jgi:LacI family transcriptional regulator
MFPAPSESAPFDFASPVRPRRLAVALLVETSNAYARGILAGVTDFMRRHEAWSITLPEQGRGDAPPAWLARWKGDGIIARIETAAIARAVMGTGIPVVDVSAARAVPSLPWVETDDRAIARLALDHFLQRGNRRVAFCGDSRFNWSKWRETAFVESARRAGVEVVVLDVRPARGRRDDADVRRLKLRDWAGSLRRPTGVFCAYDILAHQFLDVCRDAGIPVPEDVAVLGVDNDELLCNLCSPPLSSVIPDPRRAGYEAAALLSTLMSGRKTGATSVLVPPLGLAARQSSAALAVDDPKIAAAWRFIRERACEGIQVGEVVRAVGLSRRVLDRRFLELTGRTPREEIARERVARMRQLLSETDLTMAEIALRTGFDHVEYATVFFQRETGQAPGAYRRASATG